MYQDDTNGSFKIGRSSFKYNDKHVYVDGKKYKTTPSLWTLLAKAKPDRNLVYVLDKQAYKQIHVELITVPRVALNQTKVLNKRGLFRSSLLTKAKYLGDRYNNNANG